MTEVSVIVPARNAEGTLPRTLEALGGQEVDAAYEVIVVDDGSTDGTAAAARDARGPVTVITQDGAGPGAARNRAVAASSGRVLAFCDADVYPTPGWLAAGLQATAGADVVQGHVVPDPGAELGPFDRTLWITYEVGLYETANLFATREIFDRVGGFEDWLLVEQGKAMAEDVWFGWKAIRAGARTAFCAEALAHHAVFPRGWREYVEERRRLCYFPAMAAKTPELRSRFFYRRVFLSSRTAALDAALAGTAVALLTRSALPLAAGLPYGRLLRRRARQFAGRGPFVAGADLLADLVGLGAMLRGSSRYRSLLL